MIRKMNEGDLEEVVLIEKELYTNPWPLKFYKEDLQKDVSNLFVVVEQGGIIGYGDVYTVSDDADIAKVSVRKTKQGQGFGDVIMDEILRISKSRNCRKVSLEVRSSNKPARGLYIKHGFQEVGLRRKYYSDGEDAVVMIKELKGI